MLGKEDMSSLDMYLDMSFLPNMLGKEDMSSFPGYDYWGRTPPPQSWARGGETCDWRAAALTLFIFIITATCTMLRQDLTPGLAPSQHPCIQPHVTSTSSPPTPLHLIVISILAINSLSQSHYWASSRQPLRIARPPTSTQRT